MSVIIREGCEAEAKTKKTSAAKETLADTEPSTTTKMTTMRKAFHGLKMFHIDVLQQAVEKSRTEAKNTFAVALLQAGHPVTDEALEKLFNRYCAAQMDG